MSNSRTIMISLDHLVSEIVAYPLAAVEGLQLGVCVLDPALKNNTCRLWREAERYLTGRFPHTSIDELISLRNLLWFSNATAETEHRAIPMHVYVERIARSYLVSQGPAALPKLPEAKHGRGGIASGEAPEPTARRAWRWLTFALPADLLLAGLRTDIGGPVRVEMISPAVAALLNLGFAETHLHFGIAFDFSMAWAATVNLVGRMATTRGGGMKWDAFCSPGAGHAEGSELASWLVRGALVRYLLATYLSRGRQENSSFREFLNDPQSGLGTRLTEFQVSQRHIASIRMALHDLQAGQLESDFDSQRKSSGQTSFLRLQAAYNHITRVSRRTFPKTLDAAQKLDPVSDFYPANAQSKASVQLQFLWDGLRYLEASPEDLDFARLFWQVERVRCQVYRHCIQRPLTPGLTNFVRFYERKGAICNPIDNLVLESAGVLGGIERGLESLEIRTSPRSDRDDQRKEIQRLQKHLARLRQQSNANRPWAKLECGLVLHFLKQRGKDADKGKPLAGDVGNFADPDCSENTRKYRWQRFFTKQWRNALAISNAISRELELQSLNQPQAPYLLSFLCGIDVCRDEPGVPTWVIAPLFNEVRNRVNAIRGIWQNRLSMELPALKTTAHVGEDFVHLASGVRCMDEAVKFLPLVAGDRVGHGLALGVDAVQWARRSMRLAMPREDRWFDLIWERHWHSDPQSRFSSARRSFIEDEIIKLSRRIFEFPHENLAWTVQDAIHFVCELHRFETLRKLGFPDAGLRVERPTGVASQIERYLTSPTVYRNCRTVEWVEAGQDGEAVAELQRLVRRRFADLGITIEVNPISNLLVGDLSDLESHPLWRLAPGLGRDDGSTLRMCIGSDDPFPFATTLPEEYQFLYDSLILAGKSQADAREWLDTIREMGWESRFTRPVR